MTRFDKSVIQGTGPEFVAAKLAEREERHRRAGQSRYLVEPNVKDGKGGLRDLHTLFWIAKYVYRVRDVEELIDRGVFDDDELQAVPPLRGFPVVGPLQHAFPHRPRRGAAVVRHPARDRGAARLHRASGHAGRRALHEALLPDRQGRRRPHRDPVRGARRPAGQARAGAEPDDGEASARAAAAPLPESEDFLDDNNRLTIADKDVFARDPVNLHPDVPSRAEAQSGAASRRHARREQVAQADRSEAAARPRGEPAVPRNPHLARRRNRPAADERDRRARPLRARVRPHRRDDAVQHVPPLHGGRASAALHRHPRGDRARQQRRVRRSPAT